MTSTVLSYGAAPDSRQSAVTRYQVLALLCAAAAIAYVQRSGIAVAAGAIQGDLGLDKVRFGTVLSAWSLGYALMQIPSGWLADRWGSRKALTLYAVLWSAVTGLVGLATNFYSLVALWTLMGVAQAGIFPCSTKAISGWFPVERRASATGLLGSCMGVGSALAPLLTGLLLVALSWRWVFFLYAAPGFVWAVLFYRWVRDPPTRPLEDRLIRPCRQCGHDLGGLALGVSQCPECAALVDVGEGADAQASTSPVRLEYAPPPAAPVWRRLVGSSSMWLLCAQQFLRAAAMIFFATWFPTFLREARGASVVQSGFLTALAGAGAVLGALSGGFASDKLLSLTGSRRLSRQGIAVAGMTACAALIVCAYFVADRNLAVLVISAGAFCGTFGGVSGYTVAMDLGGRRVATVFSVMNMCGNFGATLFPLAIGWLVERTGNWDLVLFIFAGIFAVDAVCWALLNPKGPLFEEA